jgi:hypothetical protein
MAEELGTLYPVTIPSYADNADIQAALKLYHYGSLSYDETNTDPAALLPASAAAHFAAIEQQLADINPVTITQLQNAENLNQKITNGYYSQDSDEDARSLNSVNYPIFPEVGGVAYAGLLTVINAENIVYQTYQMHNVAGRNILYIRSRSTLGQWSAWRQISDSTHTHDERYYQKGEVDNALAGKQNTITGAATSITSSNLGANSVVVTDSSGKITQSSLISVSELNFLSGIDRNIRDNKMNTDFSNRINNQTAKSNGRLSVGVFVQQSQPSSGAATAGDLWFW